MRVLSRVWKVLQGRPEPPEVLQARLEARQRLVQRLAEAIVKRRMETPALFFLDMNRPFTFLASQGLLLAMPLAGLFISPREVESYAQAIDSEEAIDLLIARIQTFAAERDAPSPTPMPGEAADAAG